MSVLLSGLPDTLVVKVIERLRAQDDEVRLLTPGGEHIERWRALGAHVATGDPGDADLVERACTGVRTAVVGERVEDERFPAFLSGAGAAAVSRIVLAAPRPQAASLEALRATELGFVVLTTAKKPLVGRAKTRVPISKLAEAIDAADDLGGDLRLELDLSNPQSWRILRVLPPDEKI